MVMSITTGDYFANLIEGARMQALLVGSTGIDVVVTSSGGDDAEQARLVSDAASAAGGGGVVGILTVGGHADAMCGPINADLTNNLTVVSFDLEGGACSPSHLLASQDDRDMAALVLDEALLNAGRDVDVGYVSDLNYAPIIKRDGVWEGYKIDNGWNEVFFVEDAANYASAEALKSAIELAMRESPTPPSFVYAPWDYLSINTVGAIDAIAATGGSSNATSIGVYGTDVNDEDIAVMTAPGSEWMATAGGDPLEIGASLVRMVALSAAGELPSDETTTTTISDSGEEVGRMITIPIALITRDFLVARNVTNMEILDDVMPELRLPEFVRACWIGSIADVPTGSTTDNATSASSVVEFMTSTLLSFSLAWLLLEH